MRGKPCTDHLGREYPSRLARAKAWGLHRDTVDQRLAAGWSVERALTSPPEHSTVGRPVAYRGEQYRSLRAVCEAHGLTRTRAIRGGAVELRVEPVDGDRWARVAAVLDLWRARRAA